MKLDRYRLIEIRKQRKWSQPIAAKKSKISSTTYNSAESGRNINSITAQKIADAFDVPLRVLEATREQQSA